MRLIMDMPALVHEEEKRLQIEAIEAALAKLGILRAKMDTCIDIFSLLGLWVRRGDFLQILQ